MLKVMLVDNEAAIRKGLAHGIRWESLGCSVVAQAEDGEDALAQISRVLPDIVISDIRMPGMDGLTLAGELYRRWPHIKTIILTGFPDFSYAQRAIAYQVVDFVLKPTSVEQLTAAIEKARVQIQKEQTHQKLRSELASRSEENLSLQQDMLLRDLIHRVRLSTLYVYSCMAQLRMDLRNYYVLSLMVEPLEGEEEANCLPFLQDAQAILRDSIPDHRIWFITEGDQACCAVLQAPEIQDLSALCGEAVDAVGSIPRYQVSIGVSLHHTDPLTLADAAEEAEQARQFADYAHPEQPVIGYADVPTVDQEAMAEIIQVLQQIKTAVEHGKPDAAQKSLQALFRHIHMKKLPAGEVRSIYISVYHFCSTQLFWNRDTESISNSLPALQALLQSGSIRELEEYLCTFVELLYQQRDYRLESPDDLIKAIRHFIQQHYMEELTLETLAEKVHLSPSYLSKLFKRETGENLSIYIQNVRIQQAKILLCTTDLKTYEVAERVGISDPVYFSRTFKKITGMKPKDFRHAERS